MKNNSNKNSYYSFFHLNSTPSSLCVVISIKDGEDPPITFELIKHLLFVKGTMKNKRENSASMEVKGGEK